MEPTTLTAEIRAAEAQHAADIEQVEIDANEMGGDLTIGEIVALLIRRGWQPPAKS